MKNQFMLRLGELIAEREETQNTISKELGIRKQKLSNWKMGHTEPSIDDILMLAEYFDVTTDYLLGYVDEFGARIKN